MLETSSLPTARTAIHPGNSSLRGLLFSEAWKTRG